MNDRQLLHQRPSAPAPAPIRRDEDPRRSAKRKRLTALALGIAEGAAPEAVASRDAAHRRLLVLSDVLAVLLSFFLATTVAGDDRVQPGALALLPVVVAASALIGLYNRDGVVLGKTTLVEVPRLFQLATLYALLVHLAEPLFLAGDLGPGQGVGLWASFFACSVACRVGVRALAVRQQEPERCLLVGDHDDFGRVQRSLRHGGGLNVKVVGAIRTSELPAAAQAGANLAVLVRAHDAERVVISSSSLDDEQLLAVLRDMKAIGVKVSVKPRLLQVLGSAVEFEEIHGDAFLGVRPFGLTPTERRVKRAFDLVGASVALVLFAPFIAAIALAVKLGDRGPVFFRQERVGEDGKRFKIWKFRTMVVDAEARKDALRDHASSGDLFKLADDPRITRIGGLLRKTSLDELPQLFNVLSGDMALVGPRPLVADEDRLVQGWHRRRLHLTPGMTGMWQVLGSRLPLQDMVALDYLYIVDWSLWRDVQVLLKTVAFVLKRGGM